MMFPGFEPTPEPAALRDQDLAVEAFLALRDVLLGDDGKPESFSLARPVQPNGSKRSRQDDPFDVYLAEQVTGKLTAAGSTITCQRSEKPLANPDMVFMDSGRLGGIVPGATVGIDTLVGIEVKKLMRNKGQIPRLDFNSTPPCGTIKIHGKREGTAKVEQLRIRAFYACALLQETDGEAAVERLVVADGDFLNADVKLYEEVTGPREKITRLGSYMDGINRVRPMMVFGNPLLIEEIAARPTLIHAAPDLHQRFGTRLIRIGEIHRNTAEPAIPVRTFYCYRSIVDRDAPPAELINLPDPKLKGESKSKTSPRASFRIKLPPHPKQPRSGGGRR